MTFHREARCACVLFCSGRFQQRFFFSSQKKRKDGSPAKTKMQPRQDKKQLVMIQLQTVQMNRRQPKQTDVIDESIVMDSGTARVSDEKEHIKEC